jgi:hypothetical protein
MTTLDLMTNTDALPSPKLEACPAISDEPNARLSGPHEAGSQRRRPLGDDMERSRGADRL